MSDVDDDDALFGADGAGAPLGSAPEPAAQHTDASVLREHPLWQRARGVRATADAPADGARFEPLSALGLEYGEFRANADGASTLLSESSVASARAPRKRTARRVRDEDDDEALEGFGGRDPPSDASGNDDDDGDGDGDGGGDARLAFGARAEHSEDGGSSTGRRARRRSERAGFPLKGIDCVGCSLSTHIAPVEEFVRTHMERMSEEALWKFAALTYKERVQDPRTAEGVYAPPWAWKDLRSHFLLHCCDAQIARLATCRQLQTMRYEIAQRLVRVTPAERDIDRSGCELMLKVIKAESDQRVALASAGLANATAGAARPRGASGARA